MMKKKYQSGGGIHKGYPQPDKRPVIKQGGGPTRQTIREDKIAESRKSYESSSKKIKAGISAASNIPVVGKFAQAIGIGADLGTGLAKTIRGESSVKKDFLQAAVGSAALANPFKGAGAGLKKAKSFLKINEVSMDALDIAEGASTYKKGGKMPLKKASGKGKAAMQKAVSANIQELTRANREKPAGKKRSKEQIAAIAYSAARKK